MKRMSRPLLSRYEESLSGVEPRLNPAEEVTSVDKIYSSTLLAAGTGSARAVEISKYTKVLTETTDDE